MKKIIYLFLTFTLITSFSYSQGKLSSKVYFNYSYNSDTKPTNKFEIHRVYLTYKNKITKNLSYKFTSDVGRFNTGKDNRLSLYLKNALVAWTTDYGKFVFGLQGMNMFGLQEHNWGYRFVEKSPMDLHHFASSADLGLGYYNKFGKKVNFSFLVTNGTGYKKSETDNYKKYSVQLFYGNSKISKGGYNIGGSFSLEPYKYGTSTDTTTENKVVFGGFAAYSNKRFRLGAEYNIFNQSGSQVTANILSVYGNVKMNKSFSLFGRVDIFDPNSKTANDGSTYLVAGLNFSNHKSLKIAPNVKYQNPQTGNSKTVYSVDLQFKF